MLGWRAWRPVSPARPGRQGAAQFWLWPECGGGLGVHKSRSRRGETREVCSAHGPPTANGGRGDGVSDAAPEGSPRKIPGTD